MIKKANSPEAGLGRKEKTTLLNYLESVKQNIQNARKKVINKVTALLNLPGKRQEIIESVQEKTRPSILELLHADKSASTKGSHSQKHIEEIR